MTTAPFSFRFFAILTAEKPNNLANAILVSNAATFLPLIADSGILAE